MAQSQLLKFACLILGANAFLEDIFQQAFQGGGHQIHFGGGGGFRQPSKPEWPRGVSSEIHSNFNWLKGTAWMWNGDEVMFDKDGTFNAPQSDECAHGGHGSCKWTAGKKKVYVWWGDAGLHQVTPNNMKAEEGTEMTGSGGGRKVRATFSRVHDQEAAELEMDLYAIMDLPLDADEQDIKKTYRKLSRTLHPDKCSDEECRRRFHLVRNANEVLSDPEKKILYDTGGMQAVKDAEKGQVEKGNDVHVELTASLADLYTGNTVQTSLDRRIVCTACHDPKYATTERCRSCGRCPDEIKTVMQQMGPGMYMQNQQRVRSKHFCKTEHKVLEATVEKGMDTGSKIKFPRMSEQKPGTIPGDVIFTVATKKHPKFIRKGKHLETTLKISLEEALLGFKKSITHLDGHEVTIKRDGITRPEHTMQIKEEGMPVHNVPAEVGSLFVKFNIQYPRKLTKRQQGLVRQIFSDEHDEL